MALQGTIDTFPLEDVLQLLATSSKTGRLVLDGDRGRVGLWIEAGQVIGAEVPAAGAARAELVLFELLRSNEGEFSFEADPDDLGDVVPVDPAPLADSLVAALELVEAWTAIEAIVPTPRHRVVVARELPEDSVTLGSDEWRVVAAAGTDVAALAAALQLDEFSATSAVAGLVERGLLLVEAPDAAEGTTDRASALSPDPAVEPARPETVEELGDDRVDVAAQADPGPAATSWDVPGPASSDPTPAFPDRFPIDDLIGDGAEGDDPWSSPEMEQLEAQRMAAAQSFEAFELEPLPLGDPQAVAAPTLDPHAAVGDVAADGSDEVLRQMSRLSPKAAEAIAAALSSGTARDPGGPGAGTAAGERS